MTTYTIPDTYQTAINYQMTLDNSLYQFYVWWNVFGQRSYMTIKDQFGNVVVTKALIASSETTGVAPINLLAGYFTKSVMYYFPKDQLIEVLP
jgi:hypothetical protein